MPEQLQKIVQPVKSRWDALTRDQKIKLAAAVGIVLLAVILTLYFLLRTEYVELINNREGTEILEIQSVLNDQGIASRPANNGKALEVDKKRVVDAKLALDSSNIVRGEQFTFTDALSSVDFGTTTETAKQIFVKEHENKLNQELTYFDGVLSAAVTLTIPEAMRLFITESEESRAAVTLNTSHDLNAAQGEALAAHIAMSVEGLDMKNISIMDQNFRVVYSGTQEEAAKTVQGTVAEVKALENVAVRKDLVSAYSRLFHDVEVSPNLVYNDVALLERISEQFSLPEGAETGLPVTENTNSFEGENVAPDSAPGTDTNNGEQTTYQAGGEGNSSFAQDDRSVERVYDRVQTTQSQGPGSFIRETSSLTIYLYRFRTYFQEILMQENPAYETAAGWDNYKANTYGRSLNAEEPNLEQYRQEASDATGIPAANITVSIYEVPAFVDFAETPIDIPLIIALSLLGLLLLMLAYALIRRQKLVEEEEEAEPELSVEDLLVSTQLEEAKEDAEKLEEIDYAKESEIKKQIEKFVNEKPEAVAALLRNWLNTEEW